MASIATIDLVGYAKPICFLKCKSALIQMKSGEILEVSLGDPEVVRELVAIINRSSDRGVQWMKDGDRFRVQIERG